MHVPPSEWLGDILFPTLHHRADHAGGRGDVCCCRGMIVKRIRHRFVNACLLTALAGIFACGLMLAFPDCLAGQTAGLSPRERLLAASEHPEVWTMWRVCRRYGRIISGLIMPGLIALLPPVSLAMCSAGTCAAAHDVGAYTGFALIPGGIGAILLALYPSCARGGVSVAALCVATAFGRGLPKTGALQPCVFFCLFIALGPLWMVFLPGA